MRKTTLLLFLMFIGVLSYAQTLNEPSDWPNASWSVTGTYDADAVLGDPSIDSNFGFSSDIAGSGVNNTFNAESPVIDLTTAYNAGETWLYASMTYVYKFQNDDLKIDYWDADAAQWVEWVAPIDEDTPGAPLANFCIALVTEADLTSDLLDISGFTATQLSGFKYRIAYADGGAWAKGFCVKSTNLYSEAPPTCPDPTDIIVDAVTDTSVDLSWTAGSDETQWYVVVQPEGSGEPTVTGTLADTNASFTYEGLNAVTNYEVYIMAYCGVDDTSNWVGPVSFLSGNAPITAPDGVACGTDVPSAFVFTEDFDDPGYWTGDINIGNGNGSWEIPDGSTTSQTGPDAAYNGDNFMNFESSGSNGFAATIVSPAIDLSGANGEIELSFYMYAYGEGMGTLQVGVGTDPQGPFDTVFGWSGENQTSATEPWTAVGVDLSAYADQVIYIMLRQTPTVEAGYQRGDMAIDYLRVEACGEFCVAPSGVTVTDITDTTALLDWVSYNGETSWEYVVVPAGTGEPTGAGIPTTSIPVAVSGLDPDTEYEVYVRAVCDDDFYSLWSYVYEFTTEIQTEFTVDCSVGPTTGTFCYGAYDTTQFHFTASDGVTALRVTFNAGTVENNMDLVTISDSNGELYSGYGDEGDLAGLIVDGAAGPDLYISIDSNQFNNCGSGTQIPWDFEVMCITCIDPTVDYTLVSDCLNGEQFLVDVELTDMADAASVTITDSQNSDAQVVTTIGTYTFGPYANGTEVMFTVANTDDANCTQISEVLTQTVCPPDFDPLCETVFAGDDLILECGNSETELTAEYIVTGSDTSSYVLNGISCNPVIEPGEPTGLTLDDTYSGIIDLGFDFCFFGNTYDEVVIGANGLITFDTSEANQFCPWSFNASAPSPVLPTNAIFGVYHDINPNEPGCGNTIEYVLSGTAPNRSFTVNFDDVCQFSSSCPGSSTTQIILYEATNAIEINIIDKPVCTSWNSGNALAGLQNADGTIAYTPPGRNTGAWEAYNESWRYVPAGPANYTFEWLEGDTVLSSDDTITVTPSETTTYTAQVTYEKCDGTTAVVTDDITITVDNVSVVAGQPDDLTGCDDISNDGFLEFNLTQQDEVIINGQEGVTVTYYASIEDAQNGDNALPADYTNTLAYTQTIYASLEDATTGCSDIVSFDLIVYDRPIVTYGRDYEVCSNGIEPVLLDGSPIDFDPSDPSVTITWYQDGVLIDGATDVDLEVYDAGTYVVEISNENCSFSRTIEVSESGDCIIPQGISPQGDEYNQNFDLDGFNIAQIKIFNRLGKEVYSRANYTDEWHGQDKEGHELPVGTYYYVLTRQDGSNVTGWVYVNY